MGYPAVVVVLRSHEVCVCLAKIADRVPDIRRLDRREGFSLLQVPSWLPVDAHHTPGHGREDVADPEVVERNAAAGHESVDDFLFGDGLNLDLRHLFRCQPHFARWRLRRQQFGRL